MGHFNVCNGLGEDFQLCRNSPLSANPFPGFGLVETEEWSTWIGREGTIEYPAQYSLEQVQGYRCLGNRFAVAQR